MIKKLTPEQEAKFPAYVEKYTKLGLSTQPFTDEIKTAIKTNIEKAYINAGLEVPKTFVFVRSPKECLTSYIAHKKGSNEPATAKELEDAVAQKYNFARGSQDAGWISFYAFFRNEVGITGLEHLEPLENLLGLCSFWLPYENVVFVSQNPVEIHMVNGRLHNPNGPTILYEDGFCTYGLNGILLPKWIVMTPADQIDSKLILKEKNAEIRRELIRKVGMDRIYKDLLNRVIDKNGDYELIELDLFEGNMGRYLKMVNPSIGVVHIEGVPDECNTVFDALKFRNQEILGVINGGTAWKKPTILT